MALFLGQLSVWQSQQRKRGRSICYDNCPRSRAKEHRRVSLKADKPWIATTGRIFTAVLTCSFFSDSQASPSLSRWQGQTHSWWLQIHLWFPAVSRQGEVAGLRKILGMAVFSAKVWVRLAVAKDNPNYQGIENTFLARKAGLGFNLEGDHKGWKMVAEVCKMMTGRERARRRSFPPLPQVMLGICFTQQDCGQEICEGFFQTQNLRMEPPATRCGSNWFKMQWGRWMNKGWGRSVTGHRSQWLPATFTDRCSLPLTARQWGAIGRAFWMQLTLHLFFPGSQISLKKSPWLLLRWWGTSSRSPCTKRFWKPTLRKQKHSSKTLRGGKNHFHRAGVAKLALISKEPFLDLRPRVGK